MNNDLEKIFTCTGGEFILPLHKMALKYTRIKAFIFDWDGVFNDGIKGEDYASGFSEIDSMGVNMLRFENWLRKSEIPLSFIITGQQNKQAVYFAERECFNAIYLGYKNKKQALEHILKTYRLKASQIAFVFDDVLDLSLAEVVGLRFFVRRKASCMLTDFVKSRNLCDYITGNTASNFAIREVCELLLSLSGNYEKITELRMHFDPVYQEYYELRNKQKTEQYYFQNHQI